MWKLGECEKSNFTCDVFQSGCQLSDASIPSITFHSASLKVVIDNIQTLKCDFFFLNPRVPISCIPCNEEIGMWSCQNLPAVLERGSQAGYFLLVTRKTCNCVELERYYRTPVSGFLRCLAAWQ